MNSQQNKVYFIVPTNCNKDASFRCWWPCVLYHNYFALASSELSIENIDPSRYSKQQLREIKKLHRTSIKRYEQLLFENWDENAKVAYLLGFPKTCSNAIVEIPDVTMPDVLRPMGLHPLSCKMSKGLRYDDDDSKEVSQEVKNVLLNQAIKEVVARTSQVNDTSDEDEGDDESIDDGKSIMKKRYRNREFADDVVVLSNDRECVASKHQHKKIRVDEPPRVSSTPATVRNVEDDQVGDSTPPPKHNYQRQLTEVIRSNANDRDDDSSYASSSPSVVSPQSILKATSRYTQLSLPNQQSHLQAVAEEEQLIEDASYSQDDDDSTIRTNPSEKSRLKKTTVRFQKMDEDESLADDFEIEMQAFDPTPMEEDVDNRPRKVTEGNDRYVRDFLKEYVTQQGNNYFLKSAKKKKSPMTLIQLRKKLCEMESLDLFHLNRSNRRKVEFWLAISQLPQKFQQKAKAGGISCTASPEMLWKFMTEFHNVRYDACRKLFVYESLEFNHVDELRWYFRCNRLSAIEQTKKAIVESGNLSRTDEKNFVSNSDQFLFWCTLASDPRGLVSESTLGEVENKEEEEGSVKSASSMETWVRSKLYKKGVHDCEGWEGKKRCKLKALFQWKLNRGEKFWYGCIDCTVNSMGQDCVEEEVWTSVDEKMWGMCSAKKYPYNLEKKVTKKKKEDNKKSKKPKVPSTKSKVGSNFVDNPSNENSSVLTDRPIPLPIVDHSTLDQHVSQFLQSYKERFEGDPLYENSPWSDVLKRLKSIGLHYKFGTEKRARQYGLMVVLPHYWFLPGCNFNKEFVFNVHVYDDRGIMNFAATYLGWDGLEPHATLPGARSKREFSSISVVKEGLTKKIKKTKMKKEGKAKPRIQKVPSTKSKVGTKCVEKSSNDSDSVLTDRSIPLPLVDHSTLDPHVSQFLQSYKKRFEGDPLYENIPWSDVLKRMRSIGLHYKYGTEKHVRQYGLTEFPPHYWFLPGCNFNKEFVYNVHVYDERGIMNFAAAYLGWDGLEPNSRIPCVGLKREFSSTRFVKEGLNEKRKKTEEGDYKPENQKLPSMKLKVGTNFVEKSSNDSVSVLTDRSIPLLLVDHSTPDPHTPLHSRTKMNIHDPLIRAAVATMNDVGKGQGLDKNVPRPSPIKPEDQWQICVDKLLHVGWKYVSHVQLGSSCTHWFLVPGIEKKSDKRCKIGVHLLDDCMMKKFCKEHHEWIFDEDDSPSSKLNARDRGVRICKLPRDSAESPRSSSSPPAKKKGKASDDFSRVSSSSRKSIKSQSTQQTVGSALEKIRCFLHNRNDLFTDVRPIKMAEINEALQRWFDAAPTTDGNSSKRSMFVCGAPGTGKSTCIKKGLHQMEELVQYTMINGANATPNDLLHSVAAKVGTSNPSDANAICKKLRTTSKYLVVVVDEIDMFLKEKQNKSKRKKILSDLLEWSGDPTIKFGLIGIGNEIRFEEFSSLSFQDKIIFGSYNTEQLKAIIEERCNLVLDENCSIKAPLVHSTAIHLIAKKASAHSGDARRALEMAHKTMTKCIDSLTREELDRPLSVSPSWKDNTDDDSSVALSRKCCVQPHHVMQVVREQDGGNSVVAKIEAQSRARKFLLCLVFNIKTARASVNQENISADAMSTSANQLSATSVTSLTIGKLEQYWKSAPETFSLGETTTEDIYDHLQALSNCGLILMNGQSLQEQGTEMRDVEIDLGAQLVDVEIALHEMMRRGKGSFWYRRMSENLIKKIKSSLII